MTEVTISVPEIHCDACRRSIEGALRGLGGVERADVDVDAKVAHVAYREPATIDVLNRAIEEQGYDVAAITPTEAGR